MPFRMTAWPVNTSNFDSPSSCINDLHAVSGERKLDLLNIEEYLVIEKLFFFLVETEHKFRILDMIAIAHYLIKFNKIESFDIDFTFLIF